MQYQVCDMMLLVHAKLMFYYYGESVSTTVIVTELKSTNLEPS
jgi:hypothetical protein